MIILWNGKRQEGWFPLRAIGKAFGIFAQEMPTFSLIRPSILQAFWLRNWLSIIEWLRLRKERERESQIEFHCCPPTNVFKVISSNPRSRKGNLSKVCWKAFKLWCCMRKILVMKTLVYRRSRNPVCTTSWEFVANFPLAFTFLFQRGPRSNTI